MDRVGRDKASDEEKAAIEAAITDVETAVKSDDKDEIEAKTAALTEAVSGVAQKMYADATAEQAEGADSQAESSRADDAVDAEFEEVKDDKK